ncbi:hypothetical protein QCA50_004560 [Cerrena zonata]|uniref:Uncharacterized protein n=1 Tax=Cerrena zonata TaxID=2478898 RepID=A0AAW0GJT1_9APHY
MEIKKRKREDQEDIETVLTFHAAGGRTFDRLFKDKDLQHLKAGLKKKLQVPEQTEIRLTQLRDGRKVDLDDDEDFDAMRARSHSTSSINILVAIGNSDFGSPNQGSQPVSSAESLPPPKKKKRKSKAQQSTEDGPSTCKELCNKTKRVSLVEPSSTSTQLPVTPNNKPAQAVKAKATPSSSILKVSKPPAGVNGRSPGTSTNTKQVNSALSNVTQHVTFSPIVSVLTGDTQRPIASTSKEATSQPKASSSKPAETPTSLDAGKTPSKPEKKRKRSSIDASASGTSKPRHQGEEPEPSSSTQIPTPKAVSSSLEPSSEPKKKKSKSKSSGTVVEPPQPVSVPLIVPSTSTLSTSTPNKVSNQPDKSLDTNEPGSGRRNKKVNKEKVKQLKDLLRAGALSKGRVASTAPSADENPKDGTSQPNPAEGEKQRDEAPGPKEVPPIPPSDTPLEAVETLKRVTKAQEDIVRNAVYAVLNKRFPDCVLPALPVNASRSTIGAESSTSTSVPPLTQSSHLKPAPSAPATIDVFGSSVTPAKVPAAKGSKSSNQKPTPSSSKKTQGDPCPVCDAPFHLRHLCPIVKAGPDSLEKRIGELKANGADEELIKDLKTSVVRLRAKDARAEKSSESSTPSRPAPSDSSHVAARQPVTASLAVPTASGPEGSVSISTSRVGSQKNKPDALPPLVVERIISQSVIDVPSPLSTPLSARPIIPAGSVISEVTVESHGEGSSDEDESDSEDEAPLAAAVKLGRSAGSKGPKISKPLDTTDLEAVLHGPPRSSQAILAAIVSDSEEDKDENKYLDSDEEDAELEEQKTDKAFRRLSKHFQKEDSPSDDDDAPLVPPTVMDADPKAPKKSQPPRSRLSSTSSSERAVEDTVGRAESAESEVPETTPSEPSPLADNRELSLEIPPPTSTATLVGSSDPIEADSPVRPRPPVLSSQENPDDPIEPADEFLPNKKNAPVIDADIDLDSIEVDEEEINPEAIITPPPLSPIKPGTAKRMKDRRGKALNDDPEHLIVPAKVVAESTPAAVPRVTRKRGASVSQPPPTPKPLASNRPTREPASQPLVTKKPSSGVRARPPRSVPAPATAPDLAAASSTASTSTTVPAPTADAPAETKRRGRPRITPAEKARREAEKQAQKEQKAAERAAAKEAKDAAKLALKTKTGHLGSFT